ncbi:MAG: hypothetical protein RLY20_1645 [Verrucomicrobiota bacterium]|jgi:methyl-accepting chemotaxis protein WspA
MKNLTIWQRLNLTVALLILLLAIGGGLAFWMERTQSDALRTADKFRSMPAFIALESVRYQSALRACVINNGDAERRNLADARTNLEKAVDDARWRLATADALRLELKAIERAAESANTLSAYYGNNYDMLKTKLKSLEDEISGKAKDASDAAVESSKMVSYVAVGGIVVVLFAALLVARSLSRSVTAPMGAIVEGLEALQRGDFTKRIQIERQDEFGVVANGLNKLGEELSGLVGQVQRSGIQVNSTATEIAATAREQQSTANEIAATTAEIGATSKEISATSKELVKTMNEVSRVSEETAELAGSGQNAIGKMESTMRQIMDASGSITAKLAVLSEKTANINTVVTTITKVADQTNLLSLNAAIEAEKAGEYGLGFAVVAMEIRRLADQTAVATYDIEKMVKEMQSAVAAGVMGMDKFSEEVRRGVEEVRTVGTQLAQIIHQVQTLTPRFQTVNEGMHAQATGGQQISETLTQLNEAAQLTAESLRQSNQAIEQLNEAAHGLQTAVTRFKLKA